MIYVSNMGLAVGIAMSGTGIGQLFMAPLMQLALNNYGLKYSFMLIGASFTICILPICMIYYETSRHPIKMSQNEKKKSIKKIYKEIFSSLDIILMLIFLGKQNAHYI